ncbi:MAG: hypothetical protein A2022_08125 [Deltaproteobacteria bacterium GWF2_42_12]|nr:MAG: hypothetical protein A2090_06350 [Deltaproteobacteria bacterium GWD2_42_10]OGP45944.1 MAG: hypothetical protein A2022_08125 [Deltaproteobacteria bacterium GWF2_42_12]OGQ37067.1 MAG: hypothetical protein A3H47_01355 [Deltaproteobacteria bacterium RIFCSPLOWO2_02_FULL_42_39]OGQ66711.1 MAG: hypothetical protein A3F88_05940 [Deltaproteobacteria bacterium RIFCSPLOWO2_12_FULL_42_16]
MFPLLERLSHNPLFVIASDRRERGNLLFFNKLQIASVAALPRNDIMTQPQNKRGLGGVTVSTPQAMDVAMLAM